MRAARQTIAEEFSMLGVCHAFGAGGGGVGMDAVGATVGDRDGRVNQFLGHRIKGAGGRHDGFDVRHVRFEQRRIEGQVAPQVIDEVAAARGADVVEDGFDTRIGFQRSVGRATVDMVVSLPFGVSH